MNYPSYLEEGASLLFTSLATFTITEFEPILPRATAASQQCGVIHTSDLTLELVFTTKQLHLTSAQGPVLIA